MMEDFSGLALPPLFGGHILEAELEPGGVEMGPGEVSMNSDRQDSSSSIGWNLFRFDYVICSQLTVSLLLSGDAGPRGQ